MIDRTLMQLPLLGPFYARRAATIKREFCLLLNAVGWLKPITFVQWLVTARCNLRCPFCEASAGDARNDELTTTEGRELIDDLAQMGVKRLLFSGGEPLTRADVPELMAYAHGRNLSVGLVTNGFLVGDLWSRLQGLDLYLYFTSLDGSRTEHDALRGEGAFERALEGLRRVASAETPTRIVNTVVQPANIESLPRLREIVRGSGATRWHLTPLARVGRASTSDGGSLSTDQLRRLVDFVRAEEDWVDLGESAGYLGCLAGGPPVGKPFFCGAGLTRCAIMPDGSVLGCHQVYDCRYAEGNVRERPFSAIWRDGFQRFRHRQPPDFCRGCEHIAACQGGCWAEMQLHGRCLKPEWRPAVNDSDTSPEVRK
jgi:radical SAM protein with 4Fe4S-binding SPASM domain